MAFKFALIVAVACIAQGLAFQPFGNSFQVKRSAEEIPMVFEEAVNEMDEIRDSANAAVAEAYYKGVDPEVIIACFRDQSENYIAIGKRISELIRTGSQELAQEFGEMFEKYGKAAAGPLKTIGTTMRTFPQKVWEYIQNKEFTKAVEVIKESRRIVIENSKILRGIIEEMREELPEAAQKAEDLANKVREEAKNGGKAIAQAFRKCVEEGGPKKPVA